MSPDTLLTLVLVVVVAGLPALMMAVRAKRKARNIAGCCGRCGLPLPAESFPIEGMWYCMRCTQYFHRRITYAYLALAVLFIGIAVLGVASTVVLLRREDPGWWWAPVILGAVAIVLALGVRTIHRFMSHPGDFDAELKGAQGRLHDIWGPNE